MGAEQAEKPDKQDPVVAHAEARLKRIESHTTDRLEDLKSDKAELEKELSDLKIKQDEALKLATSKGNERWSELQKSVDLLNIKVRELNDKMERIASKAEDKKENVLEKATDKATSLGFKADRIEVNDDAADKRDAQRAEWQAQVDALQITITDPATPAEAKKKAVEDQGKLRAKIEGLSTVDRADAARDRQKKITEFVSKEEEKEKKGADELLAKELGESEEGKSPETKAESGPNFAESMSNSAKTLAQQIANDPPDKDNLADKLGLAWKKFWLNLSLWASPKKITWDSSLDDGQKTILKKTIGMSFKPVEGQTGYSTVEWVTPEEGYDAPNSGTQRVMQDFFGSDWFKQLDALKSKTDTDPGTTLEDLQKQVVDPPKNEEDSKFKAFVDQLISQNAKPGDNVLAWLEKNSAMVHKEKSAKSETSAEQVDQKNLDGMSKESIIALIQKEHFDENTKLYEVILKTSASSDPDAEKVFNVFTDPGVSKTDICKKLANVPWTAVDFKKETEIIASLKPVFDYLHLGEVSIPQDLVTRTIQVLEKGEALTDAMKSELEIAFAPYVENTQKLLAITFKQSLEDEKIKPDVSDPEKEEIVDILTALKANSSTPETAK